MPEPVPAKFPCPECHAPLRLRDRRYVGAVFPCPECGTSLTLRELADGVADVRRAEESAADHPSTKVPPAKQPSPTAARDTSRVTPAASLQNDVRSLEWLKSPLVISWGVALLFGGTLLFLALRSPGVRQDVAQQPLTPAVQIPKDAAPVDAAPAAPPWRATTNDTTEQRLKRLGAGFAEYESRHGEYPHGSLPAGRQPASQGWSWQAQLEANLSDHPQARSFVPHRQWNDPASERFVRRQVPEFINPSIRQVVGDSGYPTTHFVGSGGIGADGPTLGVNQPRAGLFGWDRVTRRTDVKDGLSNTIAVLGIEKQLGSWAEGGRATIRPLTAEPYVGGPDGFGTGESGRMLVLMADGSVRTVTAQTDPRLVRRMVAINDGLPLNPTVPGEPGDAVPTVSPPSAISIPGVVVNTPDSPPISALATNSPAAPVVKLPPVGPMLAQPLTGVVQQTPQPRRELLTIVEDLLGRPIRWDAAELGTAADVLQEPIVLPSEGGSVAEFFARILAGTGLTYVVEPESVRLIRTTNSDARPGGTSGTR